LPPLPRPEPRDRLPAVGGGALQHSGPAATADRAIGSHQVPILSKVTNITRR
jgi:hypothetical protein